MFPYYEGMGRVYTDEELEKLKSSDKNLQNNNKNGIIKSEKEKNEIIKELDSLNITYNPVEGLKEVLSEKEIIQKISGGDETEGSCVSVAFAYIANKNGLDVLDYRGGESRSYFGRGGTIYKISQLKGIKSIVEESSNDVITAMKLLKEVEEGKEYFLGTGQHAAIVRRNEGKLQYLELQDIENNGFKQFTTKTLKNRFGCKQSHSKYGYTLKKKNILMEVDSFKNNEEFKEIMGYLNTQDNKQMKGLSGHAK